MITHPFFIGLLLAAPALKLLGYMPSDFGPGRVAADIAGYAFRILPFALAYYFIGGRVTRWLMERGWCFASADYVIWLLWSVVGFVVLELLVLQWTLAAGLKMFFAMQCFVLPLHILKLLHFEGRIKAAIYTRPQCCSIWRSFKQDAGPAPHIAPDLEGDLLSVQAQNQYVLVTTTEGSRLIRMSMQRAVEGFNPDAGLSIHRSWWVSRNQIAKGRFDPKNSVLISADGTSYPVSKANRQPLEDMIRLIGAVGEGGAPLSGNSFVELKEPRRK